MSNRNRFVDGQCPGSVRRTKGNGKQSSTYMVLAKNTPHITPRKENRTAPIQSLDTRFFSSVRCNYIDLCCFCANETGTRLLESVYTTPTRAEVAVTQMGISTGTLLGMKGVHRWRGEKELNDGKDLREINTDIFIAQRQ